METKKKKLQFFSGGHSFCKFNKKDSLIVSLFHKYIYHKFSNGNFNYNFFLISPFFLLSFSLGARTNQPKKTTPKNQGKGKL